MKKIALITMTTLSFLLGACGKPSEWCVMGRDYIELNNDDMYVLYVKYDEKDKDGEDIIRFVEVTQEEYETYNKGDVYKYKGG